LAVLVCGAFSATGQQAMAVHEARYVLRAGEATAIRAPQETLDFLTNARSRHVDIVTPDAPVSGGRLVAAPNRDGNQILLGASLRMSPGEYTVKLSAASAAGEQRQTTLAVTVLPLVTTVPSNAKRAPVVLLNGWETGFTGTCPIAGSSSDTFGNLARYLVDDGVPVVYLFDNCLEDAGLPIETLGNDLGTFLNTIKYDTGAQVPQIDLVGFSMGGLIARAYLAGLQPNQTLAPPTTTLVNKLVLIATPNFGSFVVGNYATISAITAGTQSAEMAPGSAFLWNLANWNQRTDDLRGVSAIAIVGNAGVYTAGISSSTTLNNASDGLVSLTSASLGFAAQTSATRIVPYCHVDPSAFTNSSLGTFACNAAGIANVSSTAHYTGLIVRSFLAGTTDWQSTTWSSTPDTDPYLSKNGAMFFGMVNASGSFVSDMSAVAFGGVSLVNGADTGTIFYVDFVYGTGTLIANSTTLSTINCGSWPEPLGFTSALRCKLQTVITSVGPLAGTGGRTVNAGSTITIAGGTVASSGFGSQCSGCRVTATPAGSTTSQQLTTTSWSNTSITATLPATLTGLVTIQVNAASGSDAIAVMLIPQSKLAGSPASLQFAWTAGGDAPAAQSVQIANAGTGTLAWTATASETWMSVSPASGTAPSTLSVAISPAGLSAGTYTGSVQIASAGAANAPVSIGVTLTVTEAPASLAVAPSALTFQYTYGGTLPAAQDLAITNAGGGTLAWTASSGVYWLSVSAASGSGPASLAVSVNPVNLAAGTYTENVTITAAGATGSPAQVSITLVVTGTQPAPIISAVASAASYQPGLASGAWMSIFGTNLSTSTYTWQNSDFVNGLLPTSLQGVSVTINGVAAYVAYISPTQINLLAPDDATIGTVQVQVTAARQNSNTWSAPKTLFAPAFFTFASGAYVAALHADYSLVGAPNLLPGVVTQPAKPGETILLYGTGFGPTTPPTPAPLANPVQIKIGGMAATVAFAGLVGPGLYQFNVTVPSLPSGDAAVLATIGGVATQKGLAVSIQ
jgi:uncharacterized protein (TIGR03437 family)